MPPKRKRASAAVKSDTAPIETQKHALFTDWSKRRGVEIHGVKAAKLPGRGFGLVTAHPVKSGKRLLFVPERSMFKSDPGLLKKHNLQNASPQAQLAFSAVAKCHDAASPYEVWTETWPSLEDMQISMPLCWPSELQNALPPTAAAVFQRQLADYSKDKEAVQGTLMARGIEEIDFMYYWLIVNSRSFHWKSPGPRSAGEMVMCPFIDYMNHGPTGTGCKVLQTTRGYEVIAQQDYEAGEEIIATYGAHSNDKLLVHYGFVCGSDVTGINIDDSIGLDHLLLPALSDATKSQLQDVGFLGGYALLPADNEICFKTQVAVRAALLTCNEWEYFVSNGEDLSSDKSMQVADFLKPLLKSFSSAADSKLKELDEFEMVSDSRNSKVAIAMLSERWKQIRDAVQAFLEAQ